MQTSERPKVSVVINTYNRCAHLRNAIRSLEHIEYSDFEVVVVNGPSTDGTDDFLRSLEGQSKAPVALPKTCRCRGISE